MGGFAYGFGRGFGWPLGTAVALIILGALSSKEVRQGLLVILGLIVLGAFYLYLSVQSNQSYDDAVYAHFEQRCGGVRNPGDDSQGCVSYYYQHYSNIFTVRNCARPGVDPALVDPYQTDWRKTQPNPAAYADCLIAYWTKHGIDNP
jgi:hypothetical protein